MTEKNTNDLQNGVADDRAGMSFRRLTSEEDISLSRFLGYERYQEVRECLRPIDGEWTAVPVEFTEDWGEEDFRALVRMLRNTIGTGGAVFAFLRADERIAGFASVEGELFVPDPADMWDEQTGARKYAVLSCIQVSREMRGRGVGRRLFGMAKAAGRELGADALYISAHSSVESQAFYRAMGCTDAVYCCRRLAELEPCDRQMECPL